VQDLRGFKTSTRSRPSEHKLDFTLTQEEMRVFNPNGADYNGSGFWTVLPGAYGVRVGTSADRTEDAFSVAVVLRSNNVRLSGIRQAAPNGRLPPPPVLTAGWILLSARYNLFLISRV